MKQIREKHQVCQDVYARWSFDFFPLKTANHFCLENVFFFFYFATRVFRITRKNSGEKMNLSLFQLRCYFQFFCAFYRLCYETLKIFFEKLSSTIMCYINILRVTYFPSSMHFIYLFVFLTNPLLFLTHLLVFNIQLFQL